MAEHSGNETTTAQTGHITESSNDRITAAAAGTVAALTRNVYDESGTVLEETWRYFDVPTSGDGSEGTNYDATYFAYDDRGRQIRRKEPTGTIYRMIYDLHGNVTSREIGTNDFGDAGGEASGTNNPPADRAAVSARASAGRCDTVR